MKNTLRITLLVLAITLVATALSLAFTTQWQTQFNGSTGNAPDLPDWNEFYIGSCSGQEHRLVGDGTLRMDQGGTSTDCFGAYYRDNAAYPGTFPTDQDVRVMWKFNYDQLEWMGTQAGQVTGRYGYPQYYGVSGVDNNQYDKYHVEADGSWGSWNVGNPIWSASAEDEWHVATFDFICDGQQMDWWMDGSNIHSVNNGPVLAPGDEGRPYQFWMGNLLTTGGGNRSWTEFLLDYVYIYAVERPLMNTPAPGTGTTQTVAWQAVSNTQQPDGSTWGIEYQPRFCTDPTCTNVVWTAPWQSELSHTFGSLSPNTDYYYQVRAKWVGTPELETCWSNTVVAQIPGDPVIVVSKTAPANGQRGETITWQITVQNTGSGSATGVTVTDPIPSYVLNPNNISNSGTVQGSDIVWSLGTLSAGQSVTLSWQGTIDPATPGSVTAINNTAQACDDANHCDSDSSSTTILAPGINVSKTAPANGQRGETITWQITVQNTGSGSATGVTVTDPIPSYVLNPTNISNSGTVQGSDIVWSLGTLSAGQSVTLSWEGTIDPATPGSVGQIVNTAEACDNTNTCDDGSSTTSILAPSISVNKTAPSAAQRGDTITWQIAVQNTGSGAAGGVTVTDPIPDYVLNPSGISNGGSVQGSDIVWNLGTMSAGQSVTLSWEGTIDPNTPGSVTTINNTAEACDSANNCDDGSSTTSLERPEIGLSKTAPAEVYPGGLVNYSLTVENSGNTTLHNVTITDPTPQYIVNPTNISDGGTVQGSDIVWSLGDLAPGASKTVTWQGMVETTIPADVTQIYNNATATADGGLNAQAQARSQVGAPALELAKTGPAKRGPGEVIAYTIVVGNTGDATAVNVVVEDPLPQYVINPTNISNGGSLQSGVLVWNIGDLTAGSQVILTWEGTIDPAIPVSETELINEAEACDAGNRCTDDEARTELFEAEAKFSKDASPYGWPGSDVSYELTVENTGLVTLTNATVTDPLPNGIYYPRNITHGGTAVTSPFEGKIEMVWYLGDLAPGATVTMGWDGTIDTELSESTTAVLNIATLTSDEGLLRVAEGSTYIFHQGVTLQADAVGQLGAPLAGADETVTWTLTAHNPTDARLYEVVIWDEVPAYVDLLTVTGGTEPSDGLLRWDIGEMAPDETVTVSWTGRVRRDVPADLAELTDAASAIDQTGQLAQAEATLALKAQRLRISKDAWPIVRPGELIAYSITLYNNGVATLYDIDVRDILPEGVVNPTNLSNGGQVEGNTDLRWRIDNLTPGQTWVATWEGTVDPEYTARDIENEATAETVGGLKVEAAALSLVEQPAYKLEMTATPLSGPGERVEYAIEVTNIGLAAGVDLELSSPTPDWVVNPVSLTPGGGQIDADRLVWVVSSLAPGASTTVLWRGEVDPAVPATLGQINAGAEVTDGDTVIETEVATDLGIQNMRVTKQGPTTVAPGETIRYTLSLVNLGQATLYDLEISDPIPTEIEAVTDPGGGTLEGNSLVWRPGPLLVGESVTFSWEGRLPTDLTASQINNTVSAENAGGLVRQAEVRTPVGEPGLTLSQQATPLSGPGETVAYTLTARNDGNATAYDVMVETTIPAELLSPLITSGGGTQLDAATLQWTLGTMAPGEVRNVTWQGTIDPSLSSKVSEIENEATLYEGTTRRASDVAVTVLRIQRVALSLETSPWVRPGEDAVYTVTVENNGSATLYDINTEMPIPGDVLDPTAISGGGTVAGNSAIAWGIDDLPTGQSEIFTWRGTVDPSLSSQVTEIEADVSLMTIGGLEAKASGISRVMRPALRLDLSATPLVGPGEWLTYTLRVMNDGGAAADNLTVQTTLPDWVETPEFLTGAGEQLDSETLRWAIASLGAGSDVAPSWRGRVVSDIPARETDIVNEATLTDANGDEISDTAITLLKTQELALSLNTTPAIYPGGPISYTLTTHNPGAATLYDLTVSQPLPAGVAEPSGISGGGQVDGNTTLVWHLEQLSPGGSVDFSWQGMVDLDYNEAVIEAEGSVESAGGLTARGVAFSQVRQPAYRLEMQATPLVGPGEPVVYTMTVTNIGLAPGLDLELHSPLPDFVIDPVMLTPGGNRTDADDLMWPIANLPIGDRATFIWRGEVDPAIPATVAQLEATAELHTGEATLEETVFTDVAIQNMRLVKQGPAILSPGGMAVYTLSVVNVGAATLYGIEVVDPLPDGIEAVTDPGGGTPEGNDLVWRLAPLAPGQTTTVTWSGQSATDLAVETVRNTASAENAGRLVRQAEVRTPVGEAGLTLSQQVTPFAGPGETVEYTLTVRNDGNAPAYDVVLADEIPAGVLTPTLSAGGVQLDAVTLQWSLGTMAPGEARTVTWQGRVNPAISSTTTEIENEATVYEGTTRRASTVGVTVLRTQRVALSLETSPWVRPGERAAYTVTVKNPGTAILHDLDIEMPFPDDILDPTAISGGGTVAGSSALVWRIDQLSPGQSETLTWQGTVDPDLSDRVTEIDAEVSLTTIGGLEAEANGVSRVVRPALRLDLSATPLVGPGEWLTYTLRVINDSGAAADNLTVQTTLPDWVETPEFLAGAGEQLDGETLRWAITSLGADSDVVLSWRGRVADAIPASETNIVNEATLTDETGTETDATAVTILKSQQVALYLDATPDVYPGGPVTYTLTAINPGTATLYGVEIEQILPVGVGNPESVSAGGVFVGNSSLIWQLVELPAGQRAVLSWVGTVDADLSERTGQLDADASLTTVGGLNVQADAVSRVLRPAYTLDLAATPLAGPGETVFYTLTVRNVSQAPGYELSAEIAIPTELETVQATAGGQQVGDKLVWFVDHLVGGTTETLTWQGQVKWDIAPTLARIDTDATLNDDLTASATTLLKAQALHLRKLATMQANPGNPVDYVVVIENAGTATLYEVVVTDPLPTYVRNPVGISNGGVVEGNTALRWALPQLTAGEVVTLTWQGTLDAAIPASAKSVTNKASATTASGLERDAEALTVVGLPALGMVIQATPLAGPGEVVDYRLTVFNTSSGPLEDVTVQQDIFDNFAVVDVAASGGIAGPDAITWDVGDLAPGAQVVIDWQATLDTDLPASATAIRATAIAADLNGHDVTTQAVTQLKAQDARLYQHAPATAWPGAAITYTLFAQNSGAATLYDIEIVNPLPAELATVLDPGSAQPEGNFTLRWNITALPASTTATLVWVGELADEVRNNVVENEATLTTAGGLTREATAQTQVLRPALSLSLAATPLVGPGETITWTLTVANAGAAPAVNTHLSQPIPAHVTNPTVAGGVTHADQVEWPALDLQPGETLTRTWTGVVNPIIPATVTRIEAEATAIADNATTADSETVTNLRLQALTLSQQATPLVYAGGPVSYTLTLVNSGATTLYDLTVENPLPDEVTNPTGFSGGELQGNTTLVWRVPVLTAGATVALDWQGTIDPDLSDRVTEIVNRAVVASASGLSAEAEGVSRVAKSILILDLNATPLAGPGEWITYTLRVQNNGTAAANDLTVLAPIPDEVIEPETISAGEQIDGETLRWRIATIDAGVETTLAWRGVVATDIPARETSIDADATLEDEAGSNLVEAEGTTLLKSQSVNLHQTATPLVYPDGVITVTLTVVNVGEGTLYDLALTNPLPAGVAQMTTISAGGLVDGNQTARWALDQLLPDQSASFSWQGRLAADSGDLREIVNAATLNTVSGLVVESEGTSRIARPVLSLAAEATPLAGPGEQVVYTLTVTNHGEAPANDLVSEQSVPAYLVGITALDATIQADRLEWQLAELQPGQTEVYTWQGNIAGDIPATVDEIDSTATLYDDAGAELATQRVTTGLKPQRLRLVKAGSDPVYPGAPLIYTLTLYNPGQATLYDLTVRDPLPTGVRYLTTAGEALVGNTTVTWRLETLAPQQTRVFTWQGMLDADFDDRTLTNEATVSTAGGLTVNATATSQVEPPGLRLTYLSDYHFYAGGPLNYTWQLYNLGAAPLKNLWIDIPLPAGIAAPFAYPPDGELRGNTSLHWTIPDLDAGAVISRTWQGTVAPGFVGDESLSSTATAQTESGLVATANTVSYPRAGRLAFRKFGPTSIGAGEPITYTLRLENEGDAPLNNVTVRDPFPAGIVPPTAVNGAQVLVHAVVWDIPALQAGQVITLTWVGQIANDLASDVREIVNTATADTDDGEPVAASVTTRLLPAGLRLEKNAPRTLHPGSVAPYTLTLKNTGARTLFDIRVTDPIPAHIVDPTKISQGGRLDNDDVLHWAIAELRTGEIITLTWQGSVDPATPPDTTEIENRATATAGNGLSVEARVRSTLDYGTLALTKQATPFAGPGEGITYTLRVMNSGAAPLYGLDVRDPLPEFLNVREMGNARRSDWPEEALVWHIPTLPANETILLTWVGVVSATLPDTQVEMVNRATVTADDGTVVTTMATTTLRSPALVLAKRGPATVLPGEPVSYTLTVTNTGGMTLRDIVVTDVVPADILDPVFTDNGVLTADGIIWDIDQLLPGMSDALHWQGVLDPGIPQGILTLTNRATATAWPNVTAGAEHRSLIAQPVVGHTQIAPAWVDPGGRITYTLTISNPGPTTLRELRLQDHFPPGVAPIDLADGYELPGNMLVWEDLPDLSPGETVQRVWTGLVDDDISPAIYTLTNRAAVTALGGANAASAGHTAVRHATLSLGKQASPQIDAGGAVVYTLTVHNAGPGPARDLQLRDPLPTGVTPAATVTNLEQDQTLVWRWNQLAAGEAVTVTWQGQVDVALSPSTKAITNTATLDSLDLGQSLSAVAASIIAPPRLALSLSCPPVAQAGEALTYTAHLTNSGGTATGVQASLPLTTANRYLSPAADTAPLGWGWATLSRGMTATRTIPLQLAPAATGVIEPVVLVDSAQGATATGSCPTVLQQPYLVITKTADANPEMGRPLGYTVTLRNAGAVVARNLRVTDTLPLNAVFVPDSTNPTGLIEGRTLSWQLADLAPGETLHLRYRVDPRLAPNPPSGATLYDGDGNLLLFNQVKASADGMDKINTTLTLAVPRPVLQLEKQAPETGVPGQPLTYTLTARNLGPGVARQVELRDTLPAGLLALENSLAADARTEDGIITWPLGDLATGDEAVRTVVVVPALTLDASESRLENRAALLSADSAPAYANAVTSVYGDYEVLALKTAPTYAAAGERLNYVIQVRNASPGLVGNVVIRDPLPTSTSFIAGSAVLTPTEEAGELVWRLGTMSAGEIREIDFSLQLDAALPAWLDRVVNEATISYTGGETTVRAVTYIQPATTIATPTPVAPTATPRADNPGPYTPPQPTPYPTSPPLSLPTVTPSPTVTPTLTPTLAASPTPLPQPTLSKNVDRAVVVAGDTQTVTWQLDFHNTTPLTITNLVLQDPLPAGLLYLGSEITPTAAITVSGAMTGATVRVDLRELPPGQTATIMLHTRLTSETVAGSVIRNQAAFRADYLDPAMSNEASVTVQGLSILPVTGGLLDPRTPYGRWVWLAAVLLILIFGGGVFMTSKWQKTR